MIRNYLVSAYRNCLRFPLFTLLHVVGLGIGLCASLLLWQYASYEQGFDQFHADKDRTYRVAHRFLRNGVLDFESAKTFPKVGPAMADEFPEVENYCRLFKKYREGVVRYENQAIKTDNLYYADSSFFEVFSFPLLKGDAATALRGPHMALIEASLAVRLFGDGDPIGKRISVGSMDGVEEFEITGVIQSPPQSHLAFSVVASYQSLTSLFGEDAHSSWGWYDFLTYVKLRPEASAASLAQKLPAFVDKYGGQRLGSNRVQLSLQPLTSIHLDSHLMMEPRVNGSRSLVQFLSLLAVGILLMAWINYVNLATSQSLLRAREVGIRKLTGATRLHLVLQFMAEAGWVALLAMAVCCALMTVVVPLVHTLGVFPLTVVSIFSSGSFWWQMMSLAAIGMVLAGFYPAFVLTSFQPATVLKGAWKTSGRGLRMRKVLVVVQFVGSAVLMAGTLTIYRQMQFMQTRSLGFSNDNILILRAPDVIEDRQQYSRSLQSFKSALLKDARVQRVSLSSSVPGEPVPWYQQARRLGDGGTDERTTLFVATIDHDYWQTYNIRFVAGANYAAQHEEDAHHILLNEAAARAVGFANAQDALGQHVVLSRDTLTVLGVVANYHHTSPKEEVDPTAYRLTDVESTYFSVALATTNTPEVIAQAESLYQRFFPGVPLEYFFARDWYDRQYDGDRQFSFVFNTFAALAVLIAALGLFGLASFTITQRTREVGIRKVLGSTVQQIVLLFSRDFLKLVLVANALAMPLAWWALQAWLQNFATRVSVGYAVFAAVLALSVAIAWAAISYHAVRSALTNPVRALRQD